MIQILAMLPLLFAPPPQAPIPPRFDVVSIKLHPKDANGNLARPSRRADFTAPDEWSGIANLTRLVQLAYGVGGKEIVGLPSWSDDDFFDIDAKLPAGADHTQFPRMLQAMLADRFRMTVRRENRAMDVRWIETAKGGAKLKPANAQACSDDPVIAFGDTCCAMPRVVACQLIAGGTLKDSPQSNCAHLTLPRCGQVVQYADYPNYHYGVDISLFGATIADLARFLNESDGGAPWVDPTSLAGRYDFTLKIDLTPPDPSDPASGGPGDEAYGRQKAWRDQAGLEMNPNKLHNEMYPALVVGHAEFPAAN